MLFLKITTMNWLRGGPKKREITTNSPPPVAEALLLISKEQNDIENLLDMRKNSDAHFYIPSSSNHSRGASPTFRDVPQLAIEAQPSTQPLQITSGKEYENDDEYMLPPLEDNIEVVPAEEKASNKGTEALGPNAGKKKSPKLRISALNILKVKGTSFRSKTPDEEGQQRRRDSVDPCPTNVERIALARSNTATSRSYSAQGRRTARLTKSPPADQKQKRIPIAESIPEYGTEAGETSLVHWTGAGQVRPPSSQSSHLGGTNHGYDLTTGAGDMNLTTGGNAPGGLQPRPSSPKVGKMESVSAPPGSPLGISGGGADRQRPLSFSGIHTYTPMRITEAATLETRVRNLEGQVATLQTFVSTHPYTSTQLERRPSQISSRILHKSSKLTDKSVQTSPALGPPFREEDMALSKRPDTSHTTHSMSTFTDGHESGSSIQPESSTNGAPSQVSESVDWRSMERGGPLGQTPYGDSSVSSYLSDETINMRNRAYDALDGVPGPSTTASKRSTVDSTDTIIPNRNHNRDYGMDYYRERPVQAPGVSMTEYNGMVKLLRREYRARKKLEGQVQTLQEQMNHVLHRQLLQADPIFNYGRSPTITARSVATTSAASTQRPEPMNGRRTSSEVPTPDLTPPRGRPDLARASPHLFTGFDSNVSATDDMDDSRSFYVGVEDDDGENWQTPAEDPRGILQIGHLAPPLPTQKRTMSISQITEKASFACARAATNR